MAALPREFANAIKKMLEPLTNRVLMTIGRGVILAIKDSGNMQTAQASFLSAEVRDGMERFQQFGFTSVPVPGAEAIAVFVGGQRDHGVIISVDDRRFRVKSLGPGQTAIYDAFGSVIKLDSAGKVSVEANLVELGKGTLEKVLNGETFQTWAATHTHNSSVPGAPTSPPIQPSLPLLHLSQSVKASKLPV